MQVQRKTEIAKLAIMKACKTCNGQGCRDCAAKVERINILANASIPVAYWDYSIATFPGDLNYLNILKKYIYDIEKFYFEGKSIIFYGSIGTGKTFGACEILKAGFIKGLTGKYTTLNEMIDIIVSGGNEAFRFKEQILSVDQLVLDELDARHFPSSDNGKNMFGTNIEYVVRTRFQNKLPIIFCTNHTNIMEIFDGLFSHVFSSLFSQRNLIQIPVGGIDIRK